MSNYGTQPQLGDDDWQKWAYQAAPLFRWAGGKRRFILANSNKFPSFTGNYHEPFAGSLAVYFWLASRSETPLTARLSDVNIRLIRTFQEVKHEPEKVWESLNALIHGFSKTSNPSDFYYRVRDDFNSTKPKGDAARFMFLMATGWNGVYRTNSQGGFNVPFGNLEKAPRFPDKDDIHTASLVLQFADLRACSWETSLNAASSGDFVFLDPPYLIENQKDSNIYEKGNAFSLADHEKLAHELVNLRERGVDFMLTNSLSDSMVTLYRDLRLGVEIVNSRRSINSKTDERGHEGELIITPGDKISTQQKIKDEFDFNVFLLKNKRGEK